MGANPPDLQRGARTPAASSPPVLRVIVAHRGFAWPDLAEIWRHRELLVALLERDIKVRYKQAALGLSWALLQPLLTMLVMALIFGRLAAVPSDGVPYPAFVYAGLLPWTFFSASVTGATNSLLSSSHLITKVYFPRLLLPLAAAGSALVDLLVATPFLAVLMLWYGLSLGAIVWFVPAIVATGLAAVGVAALLSGLSVAYRDFRYVVSFTLQLWMFATPVIYPLSMLPERWRFLAFLNPLTGAVEAFRGAWLGTPIAAMGMLVSLGTSLAVFLIGASVFAQIERRFADVI